jgi:uncharacterized membrane protein (DUF4010 family)
MCQRDGAPKVLTFAINQFNSAQYSPIRGVRLRENTHRLIYAVVLFVVAAVKELSGARGLYAVASLSGLTDVDAITLSPAQLVNAGRLNAEDGWRLVVVAAISNLIFKAGAVAALGRRRLFVRILPAYGIVIVAGILMLLCRYFAF